MSEISIYDIVPTPKLADKLIGTSVGGTIPDVTYNFTLEELLQLFIPNIPANNLQGVLDYGNTATQNINLTGTINTTNINVLATANILDSVLTGETHVEGELFDGLDSKGTAGQVLTSTGSGVEWYTIPTVIPTLQQVLESGNTSDVSIILTANISAVTATASNVVSNTSLSVNGTLKDGTASAGGVDQILSSTGSGVQWVDMPVYNVISPLLYDTPTKTFSIQVANSSQGGYLSAADWINFDGKQDAIILTTTGTSGASTFVGNTLNIPVYTPDLSGYVPTSRTLTINGVTYDLSANRTWTIAAGVADVTATSPLFSSGGEEPNITIQVANATQDGYLSSTDWNTFNSKGSGTLSSVGVSMPSAFNVANSPLTANGTIAITGAGTTAQYVRGDGTLATFPTIASEAQRLVTEVYNNSGATMTKGTVVYVNGGQGNLPTIAKAIATGDSTSAQTYGVVQNDITNMNNGYVVVIGSLQDIDTQAYANGTQLYLSPTVAGAWTSVKQYAPAHLVYVGIVIRSHPTQGVVEIRIQNGFEMDELHNVFAQNPNNNAILQYKTSTSLWTSVDGTTTNIAEGTNLYYTDARARGALSLTTTGTSGAATYDNTTGVFNIPQYQSVITNPVTGTGVAGQVTFWDGTSSVTGDSGFFWDNTNKIFTVRTSNNGNDIIRIQSSGGTYTHSLSVLSTSPQTLAIYSARGTQLFMGNTADEFSVNKGGVQSWRFGGSNNRIVSNISTSNIYAGHLGYFGFYTVGSTLNLDVMGIFNRINNDNYGVGLFYKNAGTLTQGIGLASSGNVLINTTTDAGYRLDVNGTARVTSQLTLGSTITNGTFTYTLPSATGTFALTSDLPISPITGSGTLNYVPKFTSASSIGDSNIQDSGSLITLGSNTTISSGALGIGSTSLTGYNLRISKNITGATSSYGIQVDGTIQSDVTNITYGYNTTLSTAASAFTLGSLYHYRAQQGAFGAGSSVTTQLGFDVASSLSGATTNIAYRALINAGLNNYNLYMSSTAANYLAGDTAIGGSPTYVSSGPMLTSTLTNGGSGYVDGTYTDVTSGTATTGNGAYALFTVVVSGGVVTSATLTWGGSSYRVGDTLTISNTLLGGSGSGLVITAATVDSSQLKIANANGGDITLFRADTSITSGENIGTIKFESNDSTTKASGISAEFGAYAQGNAGGAYLSFLTRSITAGTSLVEAMRIGSEAQVGIGSTALTGYSLRVSKNITGATTAYGVMSDGVIQSDVTASARMFTSSTSTQATTFTLTALSHYVSQQGTFGAGSTVTNQYGFFADSTLIGATNNFGFRGLIAAGTNRWNIYMDGTASNYLAGGLGIGTASFAGSPLAMTWTSTGATAINAVQANITAQSDVTGRLSLIATSARTAAASFTITSIEHFRSAQGTFGAGSTVTNQYGFIANASLIGATNNYGFYGDIAAATGRWNLYMNGTAANYMAGQVAIGSTTLSASAALQVTSTTQGFLPPRMTAAQRAAITTPAEGLVVVQTDGTQGLYLYIGAAWHALTML